ncbi:hypothetical protein BASA81_001150 [Batrachochytrium salamandrivorans]|nr:hypothetical protein BASA81_001150 [Batrachochytrium salamandrivorans]
MSTALKLAAAAAVSALVFSKVLELSEQDHSVVSNKYVPNRTTRFAAHNVKQGEQLGGGQEFFLNKQGLYIHFRRWIPLANVHPAPIGVVVLVHGLGEHIARYAHVALALNQAGFVVYGLDHQGHGRSEGDRLHLVGGFTDYVDDVLDLVAMCKRENPLLVNKVYVLGHSMGGLITVLTLQRAQHEFAGAVISGPALGLDVPPPPAVLALLGGLSAVLPKLPVDGLPLDTLADNKPLVDLYLNDPLVSRGKIPARLLNEMATSMSQVKPELLTLPYLLFHGEGDGLCALRFSQEFHQKSVNSRDKTFVKLKGGHETLNELDGKAVKLTVDWLKAH